MISSFKHFSTVTFSKIQYLSITCRDSRLIRDCNNLLKLTFTSPFLPFQISQQTIGDLSEKCNDSEEH